MKRLKRLWLKWFCKHPLATAELIAVKDLQDGSALPGYVVRLSVMRCAGCGKFFINTKQVKAKVRMLRKATGWLNSRTAIEIFQELERHGFKLDRQIKKVKIGEPDEIEFRQEL
jgi:uncharacterized C2H2 Zn-finger protein